MHCEGLGVEEFSYKKAVEAFLKSAQLGNSEGMRLLGDMYRRGDGVGEDTNKAARWYKSSAEAGNITGMLNYVVCCHDKELYDEALPWLHRGAEMGNLTCHMQLGVYYLNGFGVREDLELARQHLEIAAKDGCEQACEILAALEQRAFAPRSSTGSAGCVNERPSGHESQACCTACLVM
eukprot:TRINITY_DN14510_c0_g1_i2.p1 TRINITY_DN14510_c0_g1~~TRINITY_DN14510_c0_g1_i2.p1  ORF type:complete len:179 (+),score=22.32 TRINITY_DN14510_c0_g1_i2:109-645(+)